MPLINLDSPLSLYSIPVMWFTSFYPGALKFLTIDTTIGYNNVQPRANLAKALGDKTISPALAARIQRMEGAHQNGNEAMPLWFAAILAGNYAGLDNRFLNTVSLAYVGMRILYNQVYINHVSVGTSWLRTTIFFTSLSLPLTVLFKAASKVASR